MFCARQAAQFGAVDLTDEETRFLLGNGPLPSFGSDWHAAEARTCRRHFGSPLRPQADGGECQIHQAIAKFRHALAQTFRNLIARQRRRWCMIALPDDVRPEFSLWLLPGRVAGLAYRAKQDDSQPICGPLRLNDLLAAAERNAHSPRALSSCTICQPRRATCSVVRRARSLLPPEYFRRKPAQGQPAQSRKARRHSASGPA